MLDDKKLLRKTSAGRSVWQAAAQIANVQDAPGSTASRTHELQKILNKLTIYVPGACIITAAFATASAAAT